ncbi:MAG: hypothetical protein ACYC7E_15845 [Armatimonadota bacterium]
MRSTLLFWLWAALLLACMVLVGCSSSGGGPDVTPGTRLTIGGDTAYVARSKSRTELTLSAPIVANSTIQVFNYQTGALITSGIIGSDGFGTVEVTPGLTVAVVITSPAGATPAYRLSTIIPSVPIVDSEVLADPASTLAAEAIAEQFPLGSQTVIDQGTFDDVLGAAEDFLAANPTNDDISLGGGLLESGSTFGSGGLDDTDLADVIAAVPATIDNNVALGKKAVYQFKEIGLPLQAITSAEGPNLEDVYDACVLATDSVNLDTVIAKYTGVGERMGTLLLPALLGDWLYIDALNPFGIWGTSIIEFTMGQGYRATPAGDYLTVTPDASLDTAGQVTVALTTTGGTYLVVLTEPTATSVEVRQTYTGDPTMQYVIGVSTNQSNISVPGLNPSLQVQLSLADSVLTTPVTFTGTVSAVGADMDSYTQITYTGTLVSAEVNSTGTIRANFPLAKPAGALPEQSIYEFPTSVSLSNASFTVSAGGASATVRGAMTVTMTYVNEYRAPRSGSRVVGPRPIAEPSQFTLTGGYMQVQVGTKSVTITGDVSAAATYQTVGTTTYMLPTTFSLQNSGVTVVDGTQTVEVTGSIVATGQVVTVEGIPYAVPTQVTLTGGYENSETDLVYDGTIAANWTNAAPATTPLTATGTVDIDGTLTKDGAQVYTVDMRFTAVGNGQINLTITRIGFGGLYVTGTGSATMVLQGEEVYVTDNSLDLTNQDGVVIHLEGDQEADGEISGTITAGGEQVATIGENIDGVLVVTFTDTTVISF